MILGSLTTNWPGDVRIWRRLRGWVGVLLLISAVAAAGCGKSRDKNSRKAQSQPATASAPRAQYSFAEPAVVTRYPAAIGFINTFLETCMTGDYLAYRRLVSRYEQPESRERFEAIYRNLRSIVVDSVELLGPERRGLWRRATTRAQVEDVYLVISTVNFDPDANISLRHRNRQVAILVFEEDSAWRMCPAPASLQPGGSADREGGAAGATSTQASQPTPEYPWETDGDY